MVGDTECIKNATCATKKRTYFTLSKKRIAGRVSVAGQNTSQQKERGKSVVANTSGIKANEDLVFREGG